MPTRKIKDEKEPFTPCFHPDHNVPSHQVFEPGTYEHTCTGCGHKMVFTVKGIYANGERDIHDRYDWGWG